MSSRVRTYLRQQHLALLCLVLVGAGGTAYAGEKLGGKKIKAGAILSKHVRDGSLLAADLAPGVLGGQSAPSGATIEGTPPGSIGFFNLVACPSGWTEFQAARGRYVVGLPANGALAGTAGTALSNLENRAVGLHSHGITDPGHRHFFDLPEGRQDASTLGGAMDGAVREGVPDYPTGTDRTGITINPAGSVPGTNAPYIQLRICQKT